jgi:hypothetical protein
MGVIDIVPLLVVPLLGATLGATLPLLGATLPLLATTVPLLTVPLVVPERLARTVPELAPVVATAEVPLLVPELMTRDSSVRPPHAAMAKSTNATGDHRPRLNAGGANMGHSLTEAGASL